MTIFQQSILCGILSGIGRLWQESCLGRALAAAVRWISGKADGSLLLWILCREGHVARAWGDSFLCRALTAVVNFPAWLLHRVYLRWQTQFDGSFFANLAFELGRETAVAESWLWMALWIIPFSRWNNAYQFAAGVLPLLCLLLRGMREREAKLDLRVVGFYPVLLFGAIVLAALLSHYPGLSGHFLIYHASAALCLLVTVSSVRNGTDLKRLAASGGFVVLVSSLYGVYQRIQGVEVNKSYVDLSVNEGMPGRVMSFFDNPNTFAQVLILLLPLLVALTVSSRHWWSRLAAAGAFAVGFVALGMTYSRASWVGIACAAVVFMFLWKPRFFPLFVVAGVCCLPLLPSTIWNRILTITNTSDSSTASRVPLYQAAIGVVETAPVSGAGLGTAAVQQFLEDRNLYHGDAPYVHAHNMYLELWVEAGLLGFVSFLASMLWNIKCAARQVRHCADSAARSITAAACCALCGGMVAGLADYLWNYPRVMCIFWFVFALAIAGVKVCRAETESA